MLPWFVKKKESFLNLWKSNQKNKENQLSLSQEEFNQLKQDSMNLPPIVDSINYTNNLAEEKKQLTKSQTIMLLCNLHHNDTDKLISLICQDNQTILSIKQQLLNLENRNGVNSILLYHNDKIPNDQQTLKENQIENNSILEVWDEYDSQITVQAIFLSSNQRMKLKITIDRKIAYFQFLDQLMNQIFGQDFGIKKILEVRLQNQFLSYNEIRSIEEIGFKNGCQLLLSLPDKHGCFPSDTTIMMSNGQKKQIHQINQGDTVLSYDYSNQKFKKCKVIETHQTLNLNLLKIKTENENSIFCDPKNPFWTEKGWKAVEPNPKFEIQQLTTNDKILNKHNQFISITSIENQQLNQIQTVYNITTEYPYNFFANDQLVVNFNIELIQIRINGQIQQLEVYPNMLIQNVKGMIQMKQGIKIEQQELSYDGKILNDDEVINNYISDTKMLTLDLKILNQPLQIKQNNPEIIQLKLVSNKQAVLFNFEQDASFLQLSRMIQYYLNEQHTTNSLLLCNGKTYDLTNKDIDMKTLKLQNLSTLILITGKSMSAYQLTYFLHNIQLENLAELKESLSFLDKQDKLHFLMETTVKEINQKKLLNQMGQNFLIHHIVALKIWTSNLVFRQLNIDLKCGKLSQWGKYLKCLLEATRYCQYYKGVAYRGIANYQNTEIYSQGEIIEWCQFSSCSIDKIIGQNFAREKGMLFELELRSAKDIQQLSIYQTEKEVVMLPFSQFIVTSVIKQENQPIYVKLKELPLPRSSKILLWIDDNPENNYHFAQELEKEDQEISVVFCTSTSEAIDAIQKYRFMIYLDDSNLRIVTDMVRFEEGAWNYEAGIKFLKYLIDQLNYDYKVLIFCGDVKKAEDNCKKNYIDGNYVISNKTVEMQKFIRFQ